MRQNGGGPPGESGDQHMAPSSNGNIQSSSKNAPQQSDGNQTSVPQHGNQHESFFRGPDNSQINDGSRDDSNRQQLNSFLNGNPNGQASRAGDFRSRFSDRDSSDRNDEM